MWSYYDGKISHMNIWNKALSEEEIQVILDLNNPSIYSENIISEWKINAGTGDVLYDYSGNQNHGTIYGAEWSVEGCTDQLACNYNSDANTDNGSCDYACHE